MDGLNERSNQRGDGWSRWRIASINWDAKKSAYMDATKRIGMVLSVSAGTGPVIQTLRNNQYTISLSAE
jgi:hypothetical protein